MGDAKQAKPNGFKKSHTHNFNMILELEMNKLMLWEDLWNN